MTSKVDSYKLRVADLECHVAGDDFVTHLMNIWNHRKVMGIDDPVDIYVSSELYLDLLKDPRTTLALPIPYVIKIFGMNVYISDLLRGRGYILR